MKSRTLRLFAALCAALFMNALAQAQQGAAPAPNRTAQAADQQTTRVSADEDFDLDIAQRKITKSDYEASTQLEISNDQRRLDLRVGVAVVASEINVQLQNVRGHVRFRGSLEQILQRINARSGESAAP